MWQRRRRESCQRASVACISENLACLALPGSARRIRWLCCLPHPPGLPGCAPTWLFCSSFVNISFKQKCCHVLCSSRSQDPISILSPCKFLPSGAELLGEKGPHRESEGPASGRPAVLMPGLPVGAKDFTPSNRRLGSHRDFFVDFGNTLDGFSVALSNAFSLVHSGVQYGRFS